jgi:uncharacterized protein
MKPTAIQERVELLDILRGIAIFGMFTVNMTADIWWSDTFAESDVSFIDSLSLVLVDLFTNGKFITIFSFLFGIGFFVQSERVMQRGESVPAFWIKRLAGLLMIGLAAEACTLPAWILIDYSIFGLGLLLFYRLSPRWIMVAAIICFAIPKIDFWVYPLLFPTPESSTQIAVSVVDALHESVDDIYAFGSFLAIGSTNLVHVWEEFTQWHYYVGDTDLLGLMLIGLYVGRIGAVWNRDTQVRVARRALPWLLTVGFAGGVAWVVMKQLGVGQESPQYLQNIANFLAWPVGMPVLGLGYAAGIALLVGRPQWRRILVWFAPIGRMALTNYLFTGFIAAVLSFQWGFGLYGKIFPAEGLVIALAALPLQILLSRWWLARFAYGPFEWLWRGWTYGKLPGMRLASA